VGLGFIAQACVLPAFRNAGRSSRLVALVSGDATKRRELARRYGAKACSYREYGALLASGEIDAVFIALPNHLHREYAVRAARAGVHVLCEKPLAPTEADCRAMIAACRRAGVKLMTAYRLHLEAATIEAIRLVKSGAIGEPRFFTSSFSFRARPPNVRLMESARGGGAVYDIGVYCINAVRNLFGAEPVEAYAALTRGRKHGWKVEESASCVLRFPGDRLAAFTVSFGSAFTGDYRVVGTEGALHARPGYDLSRGLRLFVRSRGKERVLEFPHGDQFAAELAYFSDCIRRGVEPEPSGAEGLADVRVIRALYKSAMKGRAVRLAPQRARKGPTTRERTRRPAPRAATPLVNARPPG
jgi:glucose-fructose oxidoreductase